MKKVILKLSHDKFKILKSILKDVKDSSPKAVISSINQGNLGDDIMASFTVDDEHYHPVIEELEKADLKLFGGSPQNSNKQASSGSPANYSARDNNQVDTKVILKNNSPMSVLDFAIKNGDYEKVIQFSKDYRIGFEAVKKAKDSITITVNNCIENAYFKALKSKFEVSNSLNLLIKIASSKELKSLHTNDQIKTAGLKAVELCSIHKEHMNFLIQICNNNAVPHIICIKAAIQLAKILLNDEEANEDNTNYTVKYLNLRWLNIVYHTVNSEISEKERGIIDDLISSIKTRAGDIGA